MKIKSGVLIIAMLLLGIILCFSSSFSSISSRGNKKTVQPDFESQTEKRLEEMISVLEGVAGKVNVMVISTDNSAKSIVGVSVICNYSAKARVDIINLVSSTLGISTSKIFVGCMS